MCGYEGDFMRSHDESPISPVLKQLFLTFSLESGVSYSHQLVDQVTIEIDRQRKAKGQAGPHPRRIVLDLLFKGRTQLGKIIDACERVLKIPIIDA